MPYRFLNLNVTYAHECQQCGAAVTNTSVHDAYHDELKLVFTQWSKLMTPKETKPPKRYGPDPDDPRGHP